MAKALPADRAYETLMVLPSDIPQKNIDGYIEKIKATLVPANGVLRGVQIWGRRRLTYPIKHQKDGLYVFIDYTGSPETPVLLNKLFHVTDFVLRHLTTDKVVLRPPYRGRVEGEGAPAIAGAPAVPGAAAVAGAPVATDAAAPAAPSAPVAAAAPVIPAPQATASAEPEKELPSA